MLDFKELKITDKKWVDEILKNAKHKNAENCFTNMFLWCDSFSTKVAPFENRLIAKSRGNKEGSTIYSFPTGTGPIKPAFDAIMADAREHGAKPVVRGIPLAFKGEVESYYPENISFTAETESFDYVYSAEKLSTLAGKKLHAKRNHINRFLEENRWSYEPVTNENINLCREMACAWLKKNEEKITSSYLDEHEALEKMFKYYDKLNLEGGILYSGGSVIAFTIGEVLSTDTFVTHFEKAYADINGAYPMINREFAKQIVENHPEIKYINREEDMGLEYLRKAKQSYYPEFMAEKYIAVWS